MPVPKSCNKTPAPSCASLEFTWIYLLPDLGQLREIRGKKAPTATNFTDYANESRGMGAESLRFWHCARPHPPTQPGNDALLCPTELLQTQMELG